MLYTWNEYNIVNQLYFSKKEKKWSLIKDHHNKHNNNEKTLNIRRTTKMWDRDKNQADEIGENGAKFLTHCLLREKNNCMKTAPTSSICKKLTSEKCIKCSKMRSACMDIYAIYHTYMTHIGCDTEIITTVIMALWLF